ncbi:MAG: hypothetical protein ACRDSL_23950 [Pseudonocardiaceae bacterium]
MARCWAGGVAVVALDLVEQAEQFVHVGTLGGHAVELDAQGDGHVGVLLGSDRDDGCVGYRACVASVLDEAFQVTQRQGTIGRGKIEFDTGSHRASAERPDSSM